MATQKPWISLGDFASLWIAASCAIFVGAATWVVLYINIDWVTHFIAKPFYPGFYVAYRLLSRHENASDWLIASAVLAAAFVNAFVYAGGVLIIRLLWRYIKHPESLRPPPSK